MPLPVSKYDPCQEFDGFQPAPLDEYSLWNGFGKFQHLQSNMTDSEALFALAFLDSLYPLMAQNSRLISGEAELLAVCFDPDHTDKTAGFPWCTMGAPTKGAALEKFGIAQLQEYYQQYTSVLGATLKAEIRPCGKDARLFRPQDVSSFVEGAALFYHQNNYIMDQYHYAPVHCKYVTPGRDIFQAYAALSAFDGLCYSADGSSWDANFSLSVAAVIAEWRSRYTNAARVDRYYAQMYNGYTNVGGNLYQITGQPSGHYNTSVDNSLGHCVMFAVHAHRSGLSLDELRHNVLFKSCGDDLIWSDKTNNFTPELLSATYASMGMYLDFDSLTPRDVYTLPFVGVEFHDRRLHGHMVKCYSIRTSRAKATFYLRKKKNDDLTELMKYSSLCQLTFGDELTYNFLKEVTEKFVVDACGRGTLSLLDPTVRGVLAAMQPSVLELAYFGAESYFLLRSESAESAL